jgi:hypothetical protein
MAVHESIDQGPPRGLEADHPRSGKPLLKDTDRAGLTQISFFVCEVHTI